MSRARIRIQVAVLLFVLLPATAGILAVHASATCERFVRTYVTKPVRNTVSKQTADAWARWRIAHPNWKPNPNVHRPKYVMTRDEAVQKVQFACSVDLVPTEEELNFSPSNVDPPPVIVPLHAMNSTEIAFPDQIPPEVAEAAPVLPAMLLYTPLVSTESVPEPGSLALTGTGFCLACVLLAARARHEQSADRQNSDPTVI